MNKFFLIVFLAFSIVGFGQEPIVYPEKDAFNVKRYGLLDPVTKKAITPAIWRYPVGHTEKNGEYYALVSENGNYSYVIDTEGKRVSLFNVAFHPIAVEDTRLNQEGELKFLYEMAGVYNYQDEVQYYANLDCACNPLPYYPCPARFPMDTLDKSETIKRIQKMEFVLEFYTLDSALNMCNKAIKEFPKEPQFAYYKAQLLTRRFEHCALVFGSEDYNENYPKFLWDELVSKIDAKEIGEDSKLLFYAEQYKEMRRAVADLERRGSSWLDVNLIDAALYIPSETVYATVTEDIFAKKWNSNVNAEKRKINLYDAIDQLEKVKALETDAEILLLVMAQQNAIIEEAYWTNINLNNFSHQFDRLEKQNRNDLKANPYFYEVLAEENIGFIAHIGASVQNGRYGFGGDLNVGQRIKYNQIFHIEVSLGIGYRHYLLDQPLNSFLLNFTYSTIYLVEFRSDFSFVTDFNGTRGVGFNPKLGFRLNGLYAYYGYNFVNKSKFNSIQGSMLGLNYAFTFWNDTYYHRKSDYYLLAF